MRVPLCPPSWARLETLRMDKWTWAQKPGSGATQAGTQAGRLAGRTGTAHHAPNFGCPKLRAALDGATVHWGRAGHCAGPSNEEPARAAIYGQNG